MASARSTRCQSWYHTWWVSFPSLSMVTSHPASVKRASFEGSSFYDLPALLRWFSGNIGYHHIHHLASRVPNYRLQECYESHPRLQQAPRLTLRTSLRSASLCLWDEEAQRLVPLGAVSTR